MFRFVTWALLVLGLVFVLGCSEMKSSTPGFQGGDGKLKIATSFYPLYEMVSNLGGDRVDVINLVPNGTEPHDWEPTTKHIKLMNQATILFFQGAGFEPWATRTLQSLDNKGVIAVQVSQGFRLIKSAWGSAYLIGEDEQKGANRSQDEQEWDPHIWLDPLGAVFQVEMIRDTLVKVDPKNRDVYEKNAEAYITKLRLLDNEFAVGLAHCPQKKFFTTHAAFGYLAQRYGLEQYPIMGLAPDAEPKPKVIERIVMEAKKNRIKYIFFETLVSDKVAKTVAAEIGANTLVLNPLEGLSDAEIRAGKNYLAIMRENLRNLEIGLECGR